MTIIQVVIGVIYSLIFLSLIFIMVICNLSSKSKRTKVIVWIVAGHMIGGITVLFAFAFSYFEKIFDIFFPYVIAPGIFVEVLALAIVSGTKKRRAKKETAKR
jgi:hypothetical protein